MDRCACQPGPGAARVATLPAAPRLEAPVPLFLNLKARSRKRDPLNNSSQKFWPKKFLPKIFR